MRRVLDPPALWYHDLCSCLQCSIAGLIALYRTNPLTVLGAAWEFYYVPGDCRFEEFYYPCANAGVLESMAPYHAARSTWHYPDDAAQGWEDIKLHLNQGKSAIVAVDNYYLPFRPAHRDVHAAHLITIWGFDEEANTVYIADPMPPAFCGPIDMEDFAAARNSSCPNDGSDDFFADSAIANRWLEVDLPAAYPVITVKWVREIVASNIKRYRASAPATTVELTGLKGLETYLNDLAQKDKPRYFEELYTFGWAMQANTGLHAEFLKLAGKSLEEPELVEVGRWVDRIAHHWTALRVTGAQGRLNRSINQDRIRRRADSMMADYNTAINWMTRLVQAL